MDFDFSAEEAAFLSEVEQFLAKNYTPDVMETDGEMFSHVADTPPKRAFNLKLGKQGWLGMTWPRDYGGVGRSGIYDFLLTEALSRWGAPQPGKSVGTVGRVLIRHGSDKLKAEFLPKIIRGELEFCLGYSEPQAGSDAANMQLRAVRDGDGWRLNGQKVWSSAAHYADWYWLGARTDPDSKHGGITVFLIDMKHPGLDIRPIRTIVGDRTNEVFFNDVWVSDDYVVGKVNQGWAYICEALDLERFAMVPIGTLEKKVEALCAYVSAEVRDDQALRLDPAVRRTIAQIVTQLEAARMLQRKVVNDALQGDAASVQASQYKLYMNELSQRVANWALDIMGPAGTLRQDQEGAPLNAKFERSYRFTVVNTIGGGTSEVQKNIIARRGLGLPKNF